MKLVLVAAALTGIVSSAQAAGCLSGAAVGGVAGHYAHHHAVLGAAAGCVVGHHMAVQQARERAANQAIRAQGSYPAPNPSAQGSYPTQGAPAPTGSGQYGAPNTNYAPTGPGAPPQS